MTIEYGLIDLLEDGDVRTTDSDRGKKCMLIMPLFLENKSQKKTLTHYSVARVRIHVERIMLR